jgi:DinB family protein
VTPRDEKMMRPELEAAIAFLRETPSRLSGLLQGLTEAQIRHKPRLDAWSCAENLLHLHDIEIDGYTLRLRRTLEEETPSLPDIDGERLAIERRYNTQAAGPALRAFGAARAANVARLAAIAPGDLERTAEMEGVGKITLGRLIRMWKEHDAGHIEEIEKLRAACIDAPISLKRE